MSADIKPIRDPRDLSELRKIMLDLQVAQAKALVLTQGAMIRARLFEKEPLRARKWLEHAKVCLAGAELAQDGIDIARREFRKGLEDA